MDKMSSIFTEEKQEMLTLLEKIVNQDSGSLYKEGCDKVGQIMKAEYEALGFNVEVLPEKEQGDHLYITHKDAEDPDVLLIAHMDTVFHTPTTHERPFTISENGKIATGPGVVDMKGAQVQLLYTLKALVQEDHPAYKKAAILLNSDEEIGSITSRKYIEKFAKESKAVLIIEGSDNKRLKLGRKGGGKYTLSITGQASHAGVAPENGISAILELGHKIVKLHELNEIEDVNVNVGVISGGTSPNTIAPNAEAEIDLRFVSTEQGEKMDATIRDILSESDVEGTTLELTGGITRPGWQVDDQSEALFEIVKKEGKALGLDLEWFYSGGGSDGNFTGDLGIPTIDGLGPGGGDAHQASEFLDLDSIEVKGELLLRTLKKLYEVDSIG